MPLGSAGSGRTTGRLTEQTLLQIVTEKANVGLVVVNRDRRYVSANGAYAEMMGLPSSSLGGQRVADVLPDVYEDQVRPRLDRAFAGERLGYELRRAGTDGERCYAVRYEPLEVDGAVAMVVVVISDITEQRRAEESERFQQTMLRTERELTLDGILVVDSTGKVVTYNGRFAMMWRVPQDVLETREDTKLLAAVREQLLHPELFMERVQYLYEHPDDVSHDEVELRDGRVFDRYSAPMQGPDGRYYGRVWYFRDTTERRQSLLALKAERDRAQRFLDTAEVILLALDVAGRITLINRKGCDLLGRTESELLGQNWVTTCLPPESQQEFSETFERVLMGETTPVISSLLTRSGDERLIEWNHTVQRDNDGRVVGTFSSGTDITQRRQLEEQYHQAQKMEAVGRLAAGVAHDFNNMLTTILGYCQLLLADLDADDARQADVRAILDSGEGAARLTKQLLAFSRKQIIEPTLLDLNEVVGPLPAMLGRLLGEDISIVLRLAPDLDRLTADRSQIEQVIINLAMNARDAMSGGGTLTIETANVEPQTASSLALRPVPHVSLTVTDTGTGMSPAVVSRLFEPFFTTKGDGTGTGLGLATVQGIIARSNGRIRVTTEPGRGSSFTVYLPSTIDAVIEEVPSTPSHDGASPEETILLVDDSESLRKLTRRLLEREGYEVLLASNTTEALTLFESHPGIRLILSDVIMPGGSGPDLVRKLKAQRPELKVIYMSGYSGEAISHHGVLAPGIAFLDKPFNAESLARKVREVLDRIWSPSRTACPEGAFGLCSGPLIGPRICRVQP